MGQNDCPDHLSVKIRQFGVRPTLAVDMLMVSDAVRDLMHLEILLEGPVELVGDLLKILAEPPQKDDSWPVDGRNASRSPGHCGRAVQIRNQKE